MFEALCISLISIDLVVVKTLNSNHRMHNLYANFVKILDVCKSFSNNLVNELDNLPRSGEGKKVKGKMDFVGFCVGVGQIFTTFAAKFVKYIIKK